MKLQLGGGHWDGGRFYQFVSEVRDDGTMWGTKYKVDNTSSSNFAHKAMLDALDLAERTSLSHAAQQHPGKFIKWLN